MLMPDSFGCLQATVSTEFEQHVIIAVARRYWLTLY